MRDNTIVHFTQKINVKAIKVFPSSAAAADGKAPLPLARSLGLKDLCKSWSQFPQLRKLSL
jgi:hypothetical protein